MSVYHNATDAYKITTEHYGNTMEILQLYYGNLQFCSLQVT